MSGDAELARRLAQVADRYSPDLDRAFARTFGGAFGPQLARGVRDAFAWARESSRTLAEDAAVYVRDERGDTPAREDVREFLDDVDALRDRVERLAARVAAVARGPEGKP
jgi:ubiquinone biosynthesis protein UbiJ